MAIVVRLLVAKEIKNFAPKTLKALGS